MEYLCNECCTEIGVVFFGLAENSASRKKCRICKTTSCDTLHVLNGAEISATPPRSLDVSYSLEVRRKQKRARAR